LLGVWKNIEDLEECLNLDELQAILDASRDREHRQNKFAAALKGVNLDEHDNSAKQRFDEIQMRAQARLSGESKEKIELDIFGLDVEIEEEE